MSKYTTIGISQAKNDGIEFDRKYVVVRDRETKEKLGSFYFSTKLSPGKLAAKIAKSPKHSNLLRVLTPEEFKRLVEVTHGSDKSSMRSKKLLIDIWAVVPKSAVKYNDVKQPLNGPGMSGTADRDQRRLRQQHGASATASATASAGLYGSSTL